MLSLRRRWCCSNCATCTSTSSPASWPWPSLIALKRSTSSRITTALASPPACLCCTTSSSARLFNSPVSSSVPASWRSSLVSAERSRDFSRSTSMASNRSEEHTSELQSQSNLVCRLLLEKKKNKQEHKSQLIDLCRIMLATSDSRIAVHTSKAATTSTITTLSSTAGTSLSVRKTHAICVT